MKNIYLATCFCLNAHLGGSSIATIMVLEESPHPVISYNCTMYLGGSSIATIMVLEESPHPVISYNCTMYFFL